MDKITIKLIKYFMLIIALILGICIIVSSIFLSKFYLKMQYDTLQSTAKEIYSSLNSNVPITDTITDTNVNAILIKENNIIPLTNVKMGMMPYLRSANENSFKVKGIFKNAMGLEFLYYNLKTEKGDIVVFQNNKYSSEYIKIIYIFLFFIFIFAMILSIPLISLIGKKFTNPILKLEKVASSISKGNFEVVCNIKTNDEIETLSNSIGKMATDLKKKYQLQRDFVANVSHDFKTPLSVIRSYSEAINDGLVDENNTKKFSGEIIREVDRLNSLVMDLLQLSKLQDGVYSLNKQPINLSKFVSESVNLLTPITLEKNISIITSIKPLEIYADEKYLKRVLYNFIDNAIKFSKPDSKIEVATFDEPKFIKLSVKDYGVGIDPNSLDDIWDKYYKNSQSGGMGLGLPICREILKMHGFEYGTASSPEYGTEFYFLIPKDNIHIITSTQ